MATPVACCGFECGGLTSGLAFQHFDTATGATISTAVKRSGDRSLRVNPSAALRSAATAAGGGPQWFPVGIRVVVLRVYMRIDTAPTVSTCVFGCRIGSVQFGVVYLTSTGKYHAGYTSPATGAGAGLTLAANATSWYCIDLKLDSSTTTYTIDVSLDGTAQTQQTFAAGAAADITQVFCGNSVTASTFDLYFDDVLASTTAADYPLGAGYVNTFVPTSDGTHNIAGTGDFQRTLTATDILNATTTAYQLVDDVPLESGASVDWINMLAPVNATDYVECVFGPAPGISTPTTAPRAVEVIAAIHQAATTTGNMEIRLNDNGTMGTVYTATTVAGSTTVVYKRAHFADPPSAASVWTLSGNGNFNNLKVRFGSPAALDVVPDQYFDCIMIEAEFVPAGAPATSLVLPVKRTQGFLKRKVI